MEYVQRLAAETKPKARLDMVKKIFENDFDPGVSVLSRFGTVIDRPKLRMPGKIMLAQKP